MERFLGWGCLYLISLSVLLELFPTGEAFFYFFGLGLGHLLLMTKVSIG